MIEYDVGYWGVLFAFSLKGSVFLKAACWAIPNALSAVVLHWLMNSEHVEAVDLNQMQGIEVLWSGYTFILGFLVVFRSNQAHSRFWEGATLINQVRGEWFNAISSVISFCNKAPAKELEVLRFQNLLVRLGSLLYCSALQQVCELADDTLEVIDINGIGMESMDFLQHTNDRCEVLVQWIQRMLVEGEQTEVLKIAPPILSRAFQELSRGIVNLNNVRKIKEIPFPFPYAQMITCMLIVHWFVTPMLAACYVKTAWWAAIACFAVTGAFWSLIYIALEIDQPFGQDPNDLPVAQIQRDFNQSLMTLLEPLARNPPTYQFNKARRSFIVPSTDALEGMATAKRNGTKSETSESLYGGGVMSRSPSTRSRLEAPEETYQPTEVTPKQSPATSRSLNFNGLIPSPLSVTVQDGVLHSPEEKKCDQVDGLIPYYGSSDDGQSRSRGREKDHDRSRSESNSRGREQDHDRARSASNSGGQGQDHDRPRQGRSLSPTPTARLKPEAVQPTGTTGPPHSLNMPVAGTSISIS